MEQAILSLALSGLGRKALEVAAGLVLLFAIALAFAVSSLAALFAAGPPPARAVVTWSGDSAQGAPIAQAVELARSQIGVPYVWRGTVPGVGLDCSGLVQWVYRQLGIALPRTAQQQFDATARLTPGQLEPGDLVFFARTYPSAEPITHVGIYAGNGLMVNAPDVGDVVREMPVFTGFWGAHYAGAGRVRR